MTLPKQTDLVITPAAWPRRVDTLPQTSRGLLNVVGWFGSTHKAAMWRKDEDFLAVFQERQTPGFDPQVKDWNPSFAATEAEVMATASVIVIRLENNELLNGSLGSIAETGLALTSAALRGQMVIVSIEDDLLTTLREPGAIGMYTVLEMALENLDMIEETARFFQVHRGDDLEELAAMACEAARQQMEAGLESLNFEEFLVKKQKRRQHVPQRVLLGGSGGPYAKSHHPTFTAKRRMLAAQYYDGGHVVKDLSVGAFSHAWHIPYESTDSLATALSMRTLLSIEFEVMSEVDLLLLPIMAEAASITPATKIGFLLLYTLTSGQDLKIYLEPFDPLDYLHLHLDHIDVENNPREASMRRVLQNVGISDAVLAVSEQEEIIEAFNILKAIIGSGGEKPEFKQVKKSILRQTEVFRNADNIRRVRTLVQAHLEKLNGDQRFSDFFSFSAGPIPQTD